MAWNQHFRFENVENNQLRARGYVFWDRHQLGSLRAERNVKFPQLLRKGSVGRLRRWKELEETLASAEVAAEVVEELRGPWNVEESADDYLFKALEY